MTWPHKITDPRWIAAFRWVCAASVVGAVCWPGLSAGQRFVVGVFGLFGLSSGFLTYGLLLFVIRGVPVLGRVLAFLVFYGALIGTLLLPFQHGYDPLAAPLTADAVGADAFTLALTGNLGALAAGFNALQRASPVVQ